MSTAKYFFRSSLFFSFLVFFVANFACAADFCQTDMNKAGVPFSCSSNDGSDWGPIHDCSVTCETGRAICKQAKWIKDPNGGCGEVIEPLCLCNGN